MKQYLYILLSMVLCMVSCSETSEVHDPYEDWQSRNATWFEDTVQVARAAIAQAKADHGDDWMNHCRWRMYKSLFKTTTSAGPVTDSICVRIIGRIIDYDDNGTPITDPIKGSPAATDSAHISYRGWFMPTYDYIGNGSEMGWQQEIFDTNYRGEYNPETVAPVLMSVGGLIEGFSTAVQYMVEGDEWMVFVPYTLGYGSAGSGVIPGYSTLQFRLHLVRWYESGTNIPNTWE